MKYTITLEHFDPFVGRRGELRKLGSFRDECDMGEVVKSLDFAIRDAEGRLGLSSGEAALLNKLKELFSKTSESI